jgi:hypothetical protein
MYDDFSATREWEQAKDSMQSRAASLATRQLRINEVFIVCIDNMTVLFFSKFKYSGTTFSRGT